MEEKILSVKRYYETKIFKIVQAIYRKKININTFLNRSQIFKLVKNFEAHGTWEVLKTTSSSAFKSPITQEKCACFINNFASFI